MKYRAEILELYGGRCVECGTNNDVQVHHKLVDSIINQNRFPLFLESPMNKIPLCGGFENNCHLNKKHLYKVTEREATLYEEFLKELENKGYSEGYLATAKSHMERLNNE